MHSLGPFSLSVILFVASALVAWLLARFLPRRGPLETPRQAGSIVFDAVLAGVLGGRAGFIVMHWNDYAAAPWSMLSFGDGGYSWAAGLVSGACVALWLSRRRRQTRLPVFVGLGAGVVFWLAAGAVQQHLTTQGPGLAEVVAVDADQQPVSLTSFQGRPVVVNLWASWCPPCRKEMPAFAQAQRSMPGVAFVMLNQGESTGEIAGFLRAEGLSLDHVLQDPESRTMAIYSAQVLPTTLFFDAEGKLVDIHVGELTLASLKSRLGPMLR